jgi:hypothetical protein
MTILKKTSFSAKEMNVDVADRPDTAADRPEIKGDNNGKENITTPPIDQKDDSVINATEQVTVDVGDKTAAVAVADTPKVNPVQEPSPSSQDVSDLEVEIEIPGVGENTDANESHEPQVHFVIEWENLFKHPSFKDAIKNVLWSRGKYNSTKYVDTIRETANTAKAIAENFGKGKLNLGTCEKKFDNLWGNDAEAIKDIMVEAFQVDKRCKSKSLEMLKLLGEHKDCTLTIVGAPSYFETKSAEGSRWVKKLFFDNNQVNFKLAKDQRSSDIKTLFKKAFKDMDLSAEDKVIYIGDKGNIFNNCQTQAEKTYISLKSTANNAFDEMQKQMTAIADENSIPAKDENSIPELDESNTPEMDNDAAKITAKNTYCIVEWKDLFSHNGGLLLKENSKIIRDAFKKKGISHYKNAKDFYKEQILANKVAIEKILGKSQAGEISTSKCVKELKKILDIDPKEITDREFADIALKVYKFNNNSVKAIKNLNKIVEQNDHLKLLVVAAPDCFEKMAINQDKNLKAIISKGDSFEYTLGFEEHTNDMKKLIDAALAKQDIAEGDHIIQLGTDPLLENNLGVEVRTSFIETNGLADLVKAVKDVSNHVLEENSSDDSVVVEHDNASIFSNISNWWHDVTTSH